MAMAYRKDVLSKYANEIEQLRRRPDCSGSEEVKCPEPGCAVVYYISNHFQSSDQVNRKTLEAGLRGDHPRHSSERIVVREGS